MMRYVTYAAACRALKKECYVLPGMTYSNKGIA